jgi:uncharacterized protein (TIGR01777 family)
MNSARTIVMPGGAGFLGRHLAAHLAAQDYNVVVLTRQPRAYSGNIRHLHWDGHTIGPWAQTLEGARAVINLAGRTVNCRYTAKHRAEIYDSRLVSTATVGRAIETCSNPPAVWLNSSSATIYRDADDRAMDEATGELGSGFSVDVCQKWEAALDAAPTPGTRRVALRSAIVFGPGEGGAFEAFRRVVALGLGGTLGRGSQFVSWIHIRDFCRAVQFIMEDDGPDPLHGPVNLASPHPVTNRQFMRALRQACHKRVGLPASRWMLEIGAFLLRTETELLLKSRQVVPGKLLASGFRFDFPELESALEEIVRRNEEGRAA